MTWTELAIYAAKRIQAVAESRGVDPERLYGGNNRDEDHTLARREIVVALRTEVMQRSRKTGTVYHERAHIPASELHDWRPLSLKRIGKLLGVNHAAVHRHLTKSGISCDLSCDLVHKEPEPPI